MGGEIFAADSCKRPVQKEANSPLLAYAFSGHYCAIPCQVTDETYIKVRGKWVYLYRAVDHDGQTLDFMLSERRDTAAARRFFKRAVGTNGVPDRIAIDKSGPTWPA